MSLPPSILRDPAFRDGHTWNFLSEEDEQDDTGEWTCLVTRLVNHLHSRLTDASYLCRDLDTGETWPDLLPRQAGWLLRDLSRLAQTDRTLALVGLAHLRFLLWLLGSTRLVDWPRSEPFSASTLHDHAVRAYRGQVRAYREQGMAYDSAQRLALRGCVQ